MLKRIMRAIECTKLGAPEDLELRDVPIPEPMRGQARIRVHAAGVNFTDSLRIAGRYQAVQELPFTPGLEVSGTLDAVGEGVTGLSVGDRVAAFTDYGGFAEYVTAPVESLIRLADGVSLDDAAAFLSAFGTTHHAYRQRARLRSGETVLVLGAGGGVGLAAVQLAKVLGAHVIAAASTDAKLDAARMSGADELINYRSDGLRDRLRTLTGGRGIDVVYDPVGGTLTEQAFRSLRWGGRHLVIGFAAGTIPSLPLNLPLLKGSSILGVFWGAFMQHEPQQHRENLHELFAWLAEGRLRPHIGARYRLAEASRAIRSVSEGGAVGKTILSIDHG